MGLFDVLKPTGDEVPEAPIILTDYVIGAPTLDELRMLPEDACRRVDVNLRGPGGASYDARHFIRLNGKHSPRVDVYTERGRSEDAASTADFIADVTGGHVSARAQKWGANGFHSRLFFHKSETLTPKRVADWCGAYATRFESVDVGSVHVENLRADLFAETHIPWSHLRPAL
ncbi:MAG: hypothetical protein HYS81_04350 [Candidatus Aenigmatarchaeota archaeon]|nr:MAG: hypothetical protein HYS81_04350 [Candidatus Aenigmarchaeota archaeon]